MKRGWITLAIAVSLAGCQAPTSERGQAARGTPVEAAAPAEPDNPPTAGTKAPSAATEVADDRWDAAPKPSPISVKLIEVKHDSEADDPLALIAHAEVSAKSEVELRAFAAFLLLKDGSRLSLDDAKLNAMGGAPMKIGPMIPLDLPFRAKAEGDESRVAALQIIATLSDGSIVTSRVSL